MTPAGGISFLDSNEGVTYKGVEEDEERSSGVHQRHVHNGFNLHCGRDVDSIFVSPGLRDGLYKRMVFLGDFETTSMLW